MTNTEPHDTAVVDPDLEAGEVVGEYVIDGKLGQGGFGAVFRASHPLIGKVVAIKVLARRFSVDPEMVERFQAEARAVNQIRHRHIIDIFSFGRLADGRAYYAMEYLDGETLGDKLARETRLPFEAALPILRAIARALDAAHGKGIAHRDLKPDNVFLARSSDDGDEFVKLLDFGIAKLMRTEDSLKSKTRTGMPMGTPYYMSPEQCRGRDVDHRTDFYAFGVLAYELLTGTFPIDGEDYMTILMKQISDEPPPASSRYAELPDGVDDVLAWLMRKDPADRPPSLAVAMQALDTAAEAAGIVVPRAPRSAPIDVPRPSRGQAAMATPSAQVAVPTHTLPPGPRTSRPGIIIGLVASAVAVAVVALVMLRHSTQEAPLRPPVVRSPIVAPLVESKPVAPPPPVVVSPPALVTLTIEGAPDGTEVHGPTGNLLGIVPTIQLERGDGEVVLMFEAEGYKPASRIVHPTADAALSVKLDKKASAPHPPSTKPKPLPAKGQDSIEDPFAHH
jgi:eukaryotic-like serine/threonine-protein kinase